MSFEDLGDDWSVIFPSEGTDSENNNEKKECIESKKNDNVNNEGSENLNFGEDTTTISKSHDADMNSAVKPADTQCESTSSSDIDVIDDNDLKDLNFLTGCLLNCDTVCPSVVFSEESTNECHNNETDIGDRSMTEVIPIMNDQKQESDNPVSFLKIYLENASSNSNENKLHLCNKKFQPEPNSCLRKRKMLSSLDDTTSDSSAYSLEEISVRSASQERSESEIGRSDKCSLTNDIKKVRINADVQPIKFMLDDAKSTAGNQNEHFYLLIKKKYTRQEMRGNGTCSANLTESFNERSAENKIKRKQSFEINDLASISPVGASYCGKLLKSCIEKCGALKEHFMQPFIANESSEINIGKRFCPSQSRAMLIQRSFKRSKELNRTQNRHFGKLINWIVKENFFRSAWFAVIVIILIFDLFLIFLAGYLKENKSEIVGSTMASLNEIQNKIFSCLETQELDDVVAKDLGAFKVCFNPSIEWKDRVQEIINASNLVPILLAAKTSLKNHEEKNLKLEDGTKISFQNLNMDLIIHQLEHLKILPLEHENEYFESNGKGVTREEKEILLSIQSQIKDLKDENAELKKVLQSILFYFESKSFENKNSQESAISDRYRNGPTELRDKIKELKDTLSATSQVTADSDVIFQEHRKNLRSSESEEKLKYNHFVGFNEKYSNFDEIDLMRQKLEKLQDYLSPLLTDAEKWKELMKKLEEEKTAENDNKWSWEQLKNKMQNLYALYNEKFIEKINDYASSNKEYMNHMFDSFGSYFQSAKNIAKENVPTKETIANNAWDIFEKLKEKWLIVKSDFHELVKKVNCKISKKSDKNQAVNADDSVVSDTFNSHFQSDKSTVDDSMPNDATKDDILGIFGKLKEKWLTVKSDFYTAFKRMKSNMSVKNKDKADDVDSHSDSDRVFSPDEYVNKYFNNEKMEHGKCHYSTHKKDSAKNDWLFKRAKGRENLRQGKSECESVNWFLRRWRRC